MLIMFVITADKFFNKLRLLQMLKK